MFNADKLITRFDKVLRVVSGITSSARSAPNGSIPADMAASERQHSAGLMRVNHVGEVCAQALYEAQSRFARSEKLRRQFALAGQEEEDHLAWTAERLRELDSRPSLLNPLWYAGAYALGAVAAHSGDAWSLGFVVETERQVEAHLASHLTLLPAGDTKSRAIVEQMRVDEIEHGKAAKDLGAKEVPKPVRFMMRMMAKGMTKTAYYL